MWRRRLVPVAAGALVACVVAGVGATGTTAAPTCHLAGAWTQTTDQVGSTVWSITADGQATEGGSGGTTATGMGTLSGNQLTITWTSTRSSYAGTYDWTLDAQCHGTGKLNFTQKDPGDTRQNLDSTVTGPAPTDTTTTTATTTPSPPPSPLPPPSVLKAGAITGEVAYRLNEGDWQALTVGQEIPQGAEIFTGVDSGITLQFADGSRFELRELSQLLVETVLFKENRKDVAIRLKVGELNAQVKKEKVVDTNFEVQLPTATTSVRGTVFSVSADPVAHASVVRTKEGLVEVDPTGAGLKNALVAAGKEVAVGAHSISKLTSPGKSDARGGVSRLQARARVLRKLGAARSRCKLTTPRSPSVVATKPAPKGWLVSVTVAGKATGKSSWRVTGRRVTATNAVARRIARRCR